MKKLLCILPMLYTCTAHSLAIPIDFNNIDSNLSLVQEDVPGGGINLQNYLAEREVLTCETNFLFSMY